MNGKIYLIEFGLGRRRERALFFFDKEGEEHNPEMRGRFLEERGDLSLEETARALVEVYSPYFSLWGLPDSEIQGWSVTLEWATERLGKTPQLYEFHL